MSRAELESRGANLAPERWSVRYGSRESATVFGCGALAAIGGALAATAGLEPASGRKVQIVVDNNVAGLWQKPAEESLLQAGYTVGSVTLPAGEATKSLDGLARLYDAFASFGLSRTDVVVALGGGVIGDLAGFAAATWLRGIPLVQAPTTLLAQIDSAVGGKTAIDLPSGKNLAGAFYQPRLVVVDPAVLATLPERVLAEGAAELLKYGWIDDAELLDRLERVPLAWTELEPSIERCIRIKQRITTADEGDRGERMKLNFGHTVGHALEAATGYDHWLHGEAVSLGMRAAARIGAALGITDKSVDSRIRDQLRRWKLPEVSDIPVDAEALIEAAARDKKNLSGQIHVILIEKPGRAVIQPLAPELFAELLRATWTDLGAGR